MRARSLWTLLAVGCCLQANFAGAQSGQLTGEVKTRSGQPIEAVSVTLVSSADERISRKPGSTPTDHDGSFHIPFDRSEVEAAVQQGATWQIHFQKAGYQPLDVNVLLSSRNVPGPVKAVMLPMIDRDQLTSKVDACANPTADSTSLYVFDFMSDLVERGKLSTFQQVLGFKLRTGIRVDLESAKLLTNRHFDIRLCREALVRDEDDALFAGKRLGCPGVISGYIEQENNQLKSMVRFTALVDPPLTDFAPVNFSSSLETLYGPDQKVNKAYLAFSSFVLGTLYLKDGQTSMAMQCFQHTRDLFPSSAVAAKAEEILLSLQRASPAKKLSPIRATPP